MSNYCPLWIASIVTAHSAIDYLTGSSQLDNISKKPTLETKFTDDIDNNRINESNIYKESNDFDENTYNLEKKLQARILEP